MAARRTVCNASSITAVEDFEAIRKRPAVHIGSAGERCPHHPAWEVAGNAVDEAMGRVPGQGRGDPAGRRCICRVAGWRRVTLHKPVTCNDRSWRLPAVA
jgi:hypothetical protein